MKKILMLAVFVGITAIGCTESTTTPVAVKLDSTAVVVKLDSIKVDSSKVTPKVDTAKVIDVKVAAKKK